FGAHERGVEVAVIVALGGAIEERVEGARRVARGVLYETTFEWARGAGVALRRGAHGRPLGRLGRRPGRPLHPLATRSYQADRGQHERRTTHVPQHYSIQNRKGTRARLPVG